jgi:hypothetical protein
LTSECSTQFQQMLTIEETANPPGQDVSADVTPAPSLPDVTGNMDRITHILSAMPR